MYKNKISIKFLGSKMCIWVTKKKKKIMNLDYFIIYNNILKTVNYITIGIQLKSKSDKNLDYHFEDQTSQQFKKNIQFLLAYQYLP